MYSELGSCISLEYKAKSGGKVEKLNGLPGTIGWLADLEEEEEDP